MMGVVFLSPAAAKATSAVSPFTQDQTPSTPAPQSSRPAAHKVKVWTNEELISTRTPADNYVFQKEAQAVEARDAAFNNIISCFAFRQAEGNTEETQKEIDATLQSISDSEDAVAQTRKALRAAPDNLRLRNQMELAQRTSELNQARERLWKLQQHLQELGAQPAAPNIATAPNATAPSAGPSQ
jgi:hypothetical protein